MDKFISLLALILYKNNIQLITREELDKKWESVNPL